MSNPFWANLSAAVFGDFAQEPDVTGQGHLPSVYRVSDFAEATVGLAGAGLARVMGPTQVSVDRRLASLWFDMTVRPDGWDLPDLWDAVAGNYACKDGWIRLHTNAPHHLKAALSVLECDGTRAAVAEQVRHWTAHELESAVVAAGGCAAQMHDAATWQAHPQGQALSTEPLVIWTQEGQCTPKPLDTKAPLQGLKVLDLTRVLAGPVASRFLAGFGANVLRIDPPWWNEPASELEVTLGKQCAGLDLRQPADVATLKDLLAQADVVLHGYRAEALERLGLGDAVRRKINPSAVDVRLNAYGWSGPWRDRRGFDSLVQMSCGIAARGMAVAGADKPVPLPVQALDHGTGYLLAACVLEGLAKRAEGRVVSAKLSLARTAIEVMKYPCARSEDGAITAAPSDYTLREQTSWGPAHRITAPITVGGCAPSWPLGAGTLRRHKTAW